MTMDIHIDKSIEVKDGTLVVTTGGSTVVIDAGSIKMVSERIDLN